MSASASLAPADRLIVALDVPDAAAARALVLRLGEAGTFYKIGLELCMAPGFFELLDWLKHERKQVFVDLKFFDIPETVARAHRSRWAEGLKTQHFWSARLKVGTPPHHLE